MINEVIQVTTDQENTGWTDDDSPVVEVSLADKINNIISLLPSGKVVVSVAVNATMTSALLFIASFGSSPVVTEGKSEVKFNPVVKVAPEPSVVDLGDDFEDELDEEIEG